MAASSFPGNDYGTIRISNPAALDPRGGVLHNGAFRDITGAGRVPVGCSVCKTGSTTGTTCGTVQASNVRFRELRRGHRLRPDPDQHLHPAG